MEMEDGELGFNVLLGKVAVRKIINSQLEKALSYSAYVFFIKRDGDLAGILKGRTI